MGFGKKDAPERPQYEEWGGNAFTDSSASLNSQLSDLLSGNLGSINTMSPELQGYYQGLANQYSQAQWNDLNRGYLENMNKLNQRNYNRFGTTGATGSLYDTQSLQNSYNDLASRISANTANYYNDLINNEYNRRYNTLGLYGNLFGSTGSVMNSKDLANWQIRNQNLENKYLSQVDDYNNQGSWLGLIGNTIGSAIAGGQVGGLWGAGIGALGGASSYLSNKNL